MSYPATQSAALGREQNTALEQEGLGSHWLQIDQWARTRYQEILKGGNFAHRVLARHMHTLPRMPPMEEQDVIILLIRNFLDGTKGQASVEDAVVYLARSFWDVRLATYRWIDPDTYAAIEKDELWGEDEGHEPNVGNPPEINELNIHETIRPVAQKSTIQPSVVRNASPIDKGRHNTHPNKASSVAAFASSTESTVASQQQDRSLVGSEEGQNASCGESRAVAHAPENSISITGTVARGAGHVGHDECRKSSETKGHKPGLTNRPSPGNDVDEDGQTDDSANQTSDQNNPSNPQREILPPTGGKTPNANVEGSPQTTHAERMAALNADMDRSPAIQGQVMREKLKIQYKLPDAKNPKTLYFRQYNNGRSLDWHNIEHIRALNRWRAQAFRRMWGSTRGVGVSFHEEENKWLIERFVRHQKTAHRHGVKPDYRTLNWVSITKAFNERFAGRMLPGCDIQRPLRTKSSVTTQRYRIEAISKMTGAPMKRERTKMKERETVEGVDGDETQDEEE